MTCCGKKKPVGWLERQVKAHRDASHPRDDPAAISSSLWAAKKATGRGAEEEKDDKVVALVARMMEERASLLDKPNGSPSEQISRARQVKELEPLHQSWRAWKDTQEQLEATLALSESDPDASMRTLAAEEAETLRDSLTTLRSAFRRHLLAPSSLDSSSALLELKAGVGGDEAALFVGDLARMYARWCASEPRNWSVEALSRTVAEGARGGSAGGEALKEVILEVKGEGAYGKLKFEAGVHRVQRVPLTETQGRVHTSTVAMVVLPLSEETGNGKNDDFYVDPKEVKLEVMRSRGAGGQHVNRTESAVRLTHEPTGISVSMQDSRSQHQNRAKAWAVLRARLADRKMRDEVASKRAAKRSQVAGMDRSDKVRTYNYAQDRITDHRIGVSLSGLEKVLEGSEDDGSGLEYLIDELHRHEQRLRLESMLAEMT